MALIGDLIEDDAASRMADLVTHMAELRREVECLRRQRDQYRGQAARSRINQPRKATA